MNYSPLPAALKVSGANLPTSKAIAELVSLIRETSRMAEGDADLAESIERAGALLSALADAAERATMKVAPKDGRPLSYHVQLCAGLSLEGDWVGDCADVPGSASWTCALVGEPEATPTLLH